MKNVIFAASIIAVAGFSGAAFARPVGPVAPSLNLSANHNAVGVAVGSGNVAQVTSNENTGFQKQKTGFAGGLGAVQAQGAIQTGAVNVMFDNSNIGGNIGTAP